MAAFPQGAAPPVLVVNVRYVATTEVLEQAADRLFLRRRQQKVHVVGHQDVGMYFATISIACFFQPALVDSIIVILQKTPAGALPR
jgi:hypothetical protein